MMNILEIQLSEQAIVNVVENTSTQSCEAFNRATRVNIAKHVNLSRYFAGRLASKTLQLCSSLQEYVEKSFKHHREIIVSATKKISSTGVNEITQAKNLPKDNPFQDPAKKLPC